MEDSLREWREEKHTLEGTVLYILSLHTLLIQINTPYQYEPMNSVDRRRQDSAERPGALSAGGAGDSDSHGRETKVC